MATYQELKDIVDLDVSETLSTKKFLLYMNAAFRDLSEVYKLEKSLTYKITKNNYEQLLPTELFQVVSVTILNATNTPNKEIVAEVATYDYDQLAYNQNIGYSGYRPRHIYSRFGNKLIVNSDYYRNEDEGIESTIEVKYYASIPLIEYAEENPDLSLSPPIIEQHYHEALPFYIAYRYWLNNDDESKASNILKVWERKKAEISNYVHAHRHSSNVSRKIQRVR